MDRVLKSFKNLYTGENIIKKHFLFCLLMFLPALTGVLAGFMDKDTPKTVLIVFGIAVLIAGLISLLPLICMLGFYIDFCKDRLSGVVGIPEINWGMFIKGLKVLPLSVVWCVYFLIIIGCFLFAPAAPMIYKIVSLGKSAGIGLILSAIGLFVLGGLLVLAFVILVVPFTFYIYFDYIKQGKVSANLFNPFILVDYMKKAFKETIIVEFKYILAGIVVGIGSGIVQMIFGFIIFTISFIAAINVPEEQIDAIMYSSTGLFVTIISLSLMAALIQTYANHMVEYAAADNYIEVYQNKISENEVN